MVVKGIERGETVLREDLYNVKIGRCRVLTRRINRITLSAGDLLWRIVRPFDWLLEPDATLATSSVQ